jgi:hypothetical protein
MAEDNLIHSMPLKTNAQSSKTPSGVLGQLKTQHYAFTGTAVGEKGTQTIISCIGTPRPRQTPTINDVQIGRIRSNHASDTESGQAAAYLALVLTVVL